MRVFYWSVKCVAQGDGKICHKLNSATKRPFEGVIEMLRNVQKAFVMGKIEANIWNYSRLASNWSEQKSIRYSSDRHDSQISTLWLKMRRRKSCDCWKRLKFHPFFCASCSPPSITHHNHWCAFAFNAQKFFPFNHCFWLLPFAFRLLRR